VVRSYLQDYDVATLIEEGVSMVCVFMRGTTKQVISTLSSAGWIKPGDDDWPFTVYKTEAAFVKKWKALEKAKFKLVRTESVAPKRKAAAKYTVKLSAPKDALLTAFATWLKAQVYGSVGYFDLITEKIPKRITQDADLAQSGRSFVSLPDGSLVVADRTGQIVFLDSEGGKPKAVASDLRTFLAKLAKGRTGVSDLDDKDATGRKALAAWLAKQ
jgi:hypothetical protein